MAERSRIGYPEVTGSSLVGGIGVFTWLFASGSRRISRGARKLAQTSTISKKKKKNP